MTIGILIYKKPESVDFDLACKLSLEALNQGHKLKMFLMVDGVRGAIDPRVEKIIEKGGEVTICQHNAELKRCDTGKATSGSQYDLAKIIKDCDRFLAFT